MEKVILVDSNDNPTGLMPKMEAHEKGLLHRAFSVFIFNKNNQVMLQQRALDKYHSPGLWTNTCCSHPREKEANRDAATRRLQEEMGFTTELKKIDSFIYKTTFDNGLTEHEFDHIFVGCFNNTPTINREEVNHWKWIGKEALDADLKLNPEQYTVWFKLIYDKFKNKLFNR